MAHIGLIVAILAINTISKNSTLARMFFGYPSDMMVESKDDTSNILNAIHRYNSRLFTASGAAAGIASAFHAPLVFVVNVLAVL